MNIKTMPVPATAPVELFYTRCGSATASALAIRKHWLQDEFDQPGTVLRALRDSDSLSVRNSHYTHSQTGMFREGGNIPPIWARGQGQDTVVIGITWLDEYQGILTRAGSGIETVADLKGKRLGIPRHPDAVIDFQRGAAQHGFETALKLVGLTPADAVAVDLDAPTWDTEDGPRREAPQANDRRGIELTALDEGRVDAIFLRFARGYRLSKNPDYHEVLNINTLADPLLRVNNGTPRPITVDRAFLNKHPDVVVRYLTVLLRTADWASTHREEVLNLLAFEGGGVTTAEVLGSHGPLVHRAFFPSLRPEYVAGLEVQKNFLRDWGYLAQDFDINDWVEPGPLAEAKRQLAQQLARVA